MEEVVGSIPTRSTIILPSIDAGFPHISTFQNLLSSGACHKVVTNRMRTDFGARRVSGGEFGLFRAAGPNLRGIQQPVGTPQIRLPSETQRAPPLASGRPNN